MSSQGVGAQSQPKQASSFVRDNAGEGKGSGQGKEGTNSTSFHFRKGQINTGGHSRNYHQGRGVGAGVTGSNHRVSLTHHSNQQVGSKSSKLAGIQTLNQKIDATLVEAAESTGGKQSHKFGQLSAIHHKGRSEGGLGGLALPNPTSSSGVGVAKTNDVVRSSQTLTDRQALNTISHGGDYSGAKAGRQASHKHQQFATISSNRVSKPHFTAKNAIEPITMPKAPPVMQNFDSLVNSSSLPPNRSRGGNRKQAALEAIGGGGAISHEPSRNALQVGPSGGSTYPSKSSHGGVGSHRQYQTLNPAKMGSLKVGTHSERRNIDHTKLGNNGGGVGASLSKDYFGAINTMAGSANTGFTAPGAGSRNAPSGLNQQQVMSGMSVKQHGGGEQHQSATSYLSKKPTVQSRATIRRSQYQRAEKVAGNADKERGPIKSNSAVNKEEVPYPPNTSQSHMRGSMVPPSGAGPGNQSISLTRNTSQLRTGNLLASDADTSKKHTTSQTIHVEKSNSSGVLQKDNLVSPALPESHGLASPSGEVHAPEARVAFRKAQLAAATQQKRKKQIQGMARNKIHLQYQSATTAAQKYESASTKDYAVTPQNLSSQKRDSRIQSGLTQKDPREVPGGIRPSSGGHTLGLEDNTTRGSSKQKDLAMSLNKQQRMLHSVKNQVSSGSRFVETRRSQDAQLQRSEDPPQAAGYGTVASRIAMIAKKQGVPSQRISSQDQQKKPQNTLIGSYAKNGNGLRTASFRQSQPQALTTESQQLQRGADEAYTADNKAASNQNQPQYSSHVSAAKNNNFLASPRAQKSTLISQQSKQQQPLGKSLNTEDYASVTIAASGIKPQASSKLLKSVNGNPLNLNSATLPTESVPRLDVEAQQKTVRAPLKDNYGANASIKVRPINQNKIIQAKLTNNNGNDASKTRDESSTEASRQTQPLAAAVSSEPRASESSQGSRPNQLGQMVPSTGGSDEALLPKPNPTSQFNCAVQSQATATTHQSSDLAKVPTNSAAKEPAQNSAPPQPNIFSVNFNIPDPNANPLKDFEPAKFASKTHGLITSYSANTHQGIQRNYNEDRVSIILNMTRPSGRKDITNWPKCSYFAIYDGHGGSACSDFLKDQLHLIIINQESFPRDPAQALTTGCLEAEKRFLDSADSQQPMHERSGSCGIVVLIVGKECYVANVGDSRAIMSADKGKKLFLLSRDHRPNEDYEVQRIVKNGGGIYQTQSIQNVQVPGQDKLHQQLILGPHRVIPGRLSVSRTFGDIEAKNPKYNGKEGVIIAQPEISQFSVRNDFHDFIVLGCDGIFDRLSNQQVLDACWDTINQIKSSEIKTGAHVQKTVHQVSGAMADAIIKQAAIERSMDNLTIVIVTFDNLQLFLNERPKPSRLENHLFQIKEVESGATSTVMQPTPGLSDSAINTFPTNLSQAMSPGSLSQQNSSRRTDERKVAPEQDAIVEVKTEDFDQTPKKAQEESKSRSSSHQARPQKSTSRTQNRSNVVIEKSAASHIESSAQVLSKAEAARQQNLSTVSSAQKNRADDAQQGLDGRRSRRVRYGRLPIAVDKAQ